MNLPLTLEHRIYKVSELTREIRGHLETGFFDVRVEGEVSNLRSPGSGHLYFTLKDKASQIRAVIFKSTRNLLRFHPEDGMEVRVRGGVTVYEPRGEYQILVEHLEPIGRGALEVAFQQLKERLSQEGLFDAERKKSLPFLPRRIGVVTSLQGAAIRDILVILYRRDARLQVLIAPSRVQGEGAASEIAEALSALNQQNLDLVIVGRGGGSIEDLWAFNEEPVARAIAASRAPVISAIGHEWDFTIADFVADVRAPTPSAAAVLAVRESDELERNLLRLDRRITTTTRGVLEVSDKHLRSLLERRPFRQPFLPLSERRQHVDDHAEQLLRSSRSRVLRWTEQRAALSRNLLLAAPTGLLKRRRVEVSALGSALGRLARQTHRLSQEHLSSLASRLQGSSPLSILGRGYSICRKLPDLEVLRKASATGAGQKVRVDLARGHIMCAVEESHPQNSRESFHGRT